jgi:hypothetical protein
VLKTAVDDDGDKRHTAYVVASLELRRAAWDEQEGDYALTPLTASRLTPTNGGRPCLALRCLACWALLAEPVWVLCDPFDCRG